MKHGNRFVQPAIWMGVLLDLVLIGSIAIAYLPGRVSLLLARRSEG